MQTAVERESIILGKGIAMKQVAPGIHNFTGLIAGRVYLIKDPDGLTLIDTGMSLAASRIVKQIEGAGHKITDVKRILLTHAHPDHVGGLPELKKLSGAQLVASKIEQPVVEGKEKIPRRSKGFTLPETTLEGTPVDRVVEDGDTIDEALDGLQVVFTPGHSPGHIAFWQPDKRILFCGDVLFNTPHLRLPFAIVTVDMDENKRSIKRVAELDASIVCFGHGNPLTKNAAQKIRDFARKVGS